nr:alpha-amylase family glycosyl hydrolase [Bacillus sp. FJAT-27445]
MHDYLQEMNREVFSHYDILTVGEVAFVSPEEGLLYVDEQRKELNTLFHFDVGDEMPTWDLKKFKEFQKRWYEGLWGKMWNSQFLNNHDHTRLVTRYGNDAEYRIESAKLFAAMLHSLPGMPYIYQGEEIGMTGARFDTIDDYNDIAMKNKFRELVDAGMSPEQALSVLQALSRDNSRTPIQWDSNGSAGFTAGEPWIRVNPNCKEINVENALKDPDSIFYFYKKLIELRKTYKVFVYGDYQPILENEEQLYAFTRTYGSETLLFIANFQESEYLAMLPEGFSISEGSLLIGNYKHVGNEKENTLQMKAYEARIYFFAEK